jgi:C-terminal processing protease CtpA/Prc
MQKAINLNERRQVIRPAVESPDLHYPHPQPSKNAQEAMPQSEMHGVWVIAPEGTVSVPRMTPYLHAVTRDAQEANAHDKIPIPSRSGPLAVAISPYRAATKQHDCTFETIEVLPHNIGYFKLDSFPDPAICGASADGAMIRLNDTNAIIFDLRENRGGYPETAEQIAAWLFERPAAWYNPGERSAAQSMTHSPVRNSRLGNKPVYILTSSRTVDGVEQFVYNLKMLKRATVIGERTRGETHSRPFDRNDDHLGGPMKPLTNSYGKPDWEGTGIAPDVEVKASDALQIAEESARAKIERK